MSQFPLNIEFGKNYGIQSNFFPLQFRVKKIYSPFSVQAKIIKLVGLKNSGRLSPMNLVTFAGTQNGE
jgi:hypothetical protein